MSWIIPERKITGCEECPFCHLPTMSHSKMYCTIDTRVDEGAWKEHKKRGLGWSSLVLLVYQAAWIIVGNNLVLYAARRNP